MKYVKLTLQYMGGKSFWKLALITLLPSFIFALFASFSKIAHFFINFFEQDLMSFKKIYSNLTDLNLPYTLFIIASLVVFSIIISIIIGTLQRHMRTGKFAIKNIFKRINENFLPSIFTLILLYALIYFFGLSISLIISFWISVTGSKIATLILSAFFTFVLFLLFSYCIALFSLICPFMVATGANIFSAASASIRSARNHIKPILFAFILPLILLFLQYIGVLINIWIIQLLIDTIFVSFLLCYYPVLAFVIFYDTEELDREDLLPVNRI